MAVDGADAGGETGLTSPDDSVDASVPPEAAIAAAAAAADEADAAAAGAVAADGVAADEAAVDVEAAVAAATIVVAAGFVAVDDADAEGETRMPSPWAPVAITSDAETDARKVSMSSWACEFISWPSDSASSLAESS